MDKYFEQYLKSVNFKRYLKFLKIKLKNKTAVIYGTGLLFQYIQKNFDLSQLNIIGISDMKYSDNLEGELDLGYKIIPKNKIVEYNPDYVILAVEKYYNLIENMQQKDFENTNISLLPLVKKNFYDLINFIWRKGK